MGGIGVLLSRRTALAGRIRFYRPGALSGKRKRVNPVSPPPPPQTPPPVRLDKVSGGFRLSMNPALPPTPRQITVRLGYAVRTGDPVKRYVPEDFRIESGEFRLDSEAADIVTRSENQLVVNLKGPTSYAKLTGFDPHRDLQIRLKQSEIESA